MTKIVYVNRLNPKVSDNNNQEMIYSMELQTTEQDFERFCTRFGNVIECVIFPENDKLSK